jgi:hypothetical protein
MYFYAAWHAASAAFGKEVRHTSAAEGLVLLQVLKMLDNCFVGADQQQLKL